MKPAPSPSSALAAALDEFAAGSYEDVYADEPTFLPVAGLTDPDAAMGVCDCVSEQLAAFLVERGFSAEVVMTEDATTWGYQGTSHSGFPTEHGGIHYAVEVEGLLVDFTASQFIGQHSLPTIKEA
jgi:hypothetical protein